MNEVNKVKKFTAEKRFAKYVSQNIFGMLGMSAYILADTFFISRAEGANGITALNLVLPLYSLIFAIGSMLGIGAATKFNIQRAKGEADADVYFFNSIMWTLAISIIFMVLGVLAPNKIVSFLGGNTEIVAVGAVYTRIFMTFTPFFMWNYIFNAFVRNDGNPILAMAATLLSSLFNIVMDYVLMFPMNMGMAGAALATAVSPVVGIGICSIHFFMKKNTIRCRWYRPSVQRLVQSCQLGVSAFVGEISSGVITIVFNFLLLRLAGNDAVAAYGIVANTAIVATAIFNGISQGAQPLLSEYYGKGDGKSGKTVLILAIGTAILFSALILGVIFSMTDAIVAVFNSDKNPSLTKYAAEGLRIYFPGFLFAGFNIVGAGYLSATEVSVWAFVTSILRGFVAIIVCACALSAVFGMIGVWMAFPAAELITAVVMVFVINNIVQKVN